jgi:hypothetical protein
MEVLKEEGQLPEGGCESASFGRVRGERVVAPLAKGAKAFAIKQAAQLVMSPEKPTCQRRCHEHTAEQVMDRHATTVNASITSLQRTSLSTSSIQRVVLLRRWRLDDRSPEDKMQ